MTKQLNIGVVGTSWWAEIAFLPILQNYERANLVAICGRNHQRADEMASKYAVPRVYTDYRQMIQQAGLDALVVSTPDDTHYEIVMAALEAGLHVLCEKPVALNADHALEMLNKAEAVGARLFIDCILDDKLITPGFSEGYKVQQIIDAVMKSHESGCRVVIGQ